MYKDHLVTYHFIIKKLHHIPLEQHGMAED